MIIVYFALLSIILLPIFPIVVIWSVLKNSKEKKMVGLMGCIIVVLLFGITSEIQTLYSPPSVKQSTPKLSHSVGESWGTGVQRISAVRD